MVECMLASQASLASFTSLTSPFQKSCALAHEQVQSLRHEALVRKHLYSHGPYFHSSVQILTQPSTDTQTHSPVQILKHTTQCRYSHSPKCRYSHSPVQILGLVVLEMPVQVRHHQRVEVTSLTRLKLNVRTRAGLSTQTNWDSHTLAKGYSASPNQQPDVFINKHTLSLRGATV